MGGKIVYIALGSNLGDRAANLGRAVAALNSARIRVTRQSPIYLTEPVDEPGQARFLNAVVEAETSLLPLQLLPDLVKNYEVWEASHRDDTGLFHQIDDRDGMEYSIGGSGYRPTINSYMYGDAVAIANIAALAGQHDLAFAGDFGKHGKTFLL